MPFTVRRHTALTSALLLALSLTLVSGSPANTGSGATDTAGSGSFVPDRVLVRFEPGADREALAEAAGAQGRASLGFPGGEVWKVDDPAAVVNLLDGHPDLVYAERDHYVQAQRTPNDTLWPSQWGARKVEAPAAWDKTTGDSGVLVAVLDTGLDEEHEDIGGVVSGGNIVDNVLETLTQTVRSVVGLSETDDVHGHGTSSTSVAAGRTNNELGVAGICWHCSVLPVKVLSDTGTGTLSDLAAGVTWAADQGAGVINMSLGSPNRTQAIQDAVNYADERDALLIGAAGNAGVTEKFYPAALDKVIGVGASDQSDNRFAFSNYGDWVELAAPGCNPAAKPVELYTPAFCGTSSAAPVVAGVGGLARAADPTATADEVHTALTSTAVDVGNWVSDGRVDAAAAVASVQGSPDSPEGADTTVDGDTADGGSSTDGDGSADGGGSTDGDGSADGGGSTDGDGGGSTDGDGGGSTDGDGPIDGGLTGDDEPPAACPEGDVPPAGFTDTAGNAHRPSIDCVSWYGIAHGTSPDTYSPALAVRRDQMATFLVRLLETADADVPAPRDQGFTDIDGNSHADNINRLAELGIAHGTGPNTYSPAVAVRRDQMATFLARAYEHLHGQELPAPDSGFTDTAGNPHATNIDKAAAADFAKGTSPGTYSPARHVRRDQMASFLARTLQRGAEDGHVSPPSS